MTDEREGKLLWGNDRPKWADILRECMVELTTPEGSVGLAFVAQPMEAPDEMNVAASIVGSPEMLTGVIVQSAHHDERIRSIIISAATYLTLDRIQQQRLMSADEEGCGHA
uniref:Uncharacterized protein n=1 Tax=viral metagenome TaxID=1070528 RepID=A0A6M3KYL3_9ZZZZ